MHAVPRSICVLVLTILSQGAECQVQNGEIMGSITDPSGAVIRDARVLVSNLASGHTVDVLSNQSGIYHATELLVGLYTISVQKTGFRTAKSTPFMLNVGTIRRADFQLQVGPSTETLEITGVTSDVNTENVRLSETIDSTRITNLPLNGRNVYDLIQYSAGATNVRGVMYENGANTVVNGVRENFNGFLINGLSNKALSGGPVNQPIQDTVQEFQLVMLNNSVEFGNSAGAITNLVTKSGSNELHGTAWEYFRNDNLAANPFFANHDPDPANRQRTPLHLNQFGGTFGGPLIRQKMFFFGAYQGDRFVMSTPSVVQVESSRFREATISEFPNSVAALLFKNFPPAAQGTPFLTLREYVTSANGPFSGAGFARFSDYLCPATLDPLHINPVSAGALSTRFAKLFGVEQNDIDEMNLPPEEGGCSGGSPFTSTQTGAFNRGDIFLEQMVNSGKSQVEGNLFNGNEGSLRLDINAKPADRLFGQFNWARSGDKFFTSPLVLRGFLNPSDVVTPNFQFSYIHTFAPTLLNEFKAGYAGNLLDISVGQPGVPAVFIDDGTLGFGSYSGYPQMFRENIYTYADMVSINRGKHSVKMGVEVRRNLENSEFNVGRPSYIFFDPLFLAADAPSEETAGVDPGFLNSRPAQLATNARHWRNWEVAGFVQDDWKVGRWFTLNAGIRYDLFTRHTELNNLSTTFLKGPGANLIDDITTGAGQIKDASSPCPGNPRAVIAGACGPGGFAPASSLGRGDHNNFGPRLGFAWDVFRNGRTSMRAGYGLSYEGTLYNPLSNTRWNPPYYSLDAARNYLAGDQNDVVYGPVNGGSPTFLGASPAAQHAGTGLQATGNISGWDPANPHIAALTAIVFPDRIRDPYIENWFVGVQHEVHPGMVVQVNYVGTAGHGLFRAEAVNRIPGARLPEGTCVIDNFGRRLCSKIDTRMDPSGFEINPLGRLNANQGFLRVWENSANSIYHGLQVSVQSRVTHGIQFGGNYTWSHAIDSGSSWHSGGTTANGFAAGDGVSTDFTLPGLDRGNSVFDIRHRLTIYYVWQLAFFTGRQGVISSLLGGWQWNGIFSMQSGAHWSPFRGSLSSRGPVFDDNGTGACDPATFSPSQCFNVGEDYNLDGVANDRPNAIAQHVNATKADWADGFHLPDNFFSAPCLGCTGNLGRNTFLGPGYWALDASLFKSIQLSHALRLQVRAEAFNLFNHTNFQLGGPTGPAGTGNLRNPFFGRAGGTSNPRELQLGLRLNF